MDLTSVGFILANIDAVLSSIKSALNCEKHTCLLSIYSVDVVIKFSIWRLINQDLIWLSRYSINLICIVDNLLEK